MTLLHMLTEWSVLCVVHTVSEVFIKPVPDAPFSFPNISLGSSVCGITRQTSDHINHIHIINEQRLFNLILYHYHNNAQNSHRFNLRARGM